MLPPTAYTWKPKRVPWSTRPPSTATASMMSSCIGIPPGRDVPSRVKAAMLGIVRSRLIGAAFVISSAVPRKMLSVPSVTMKLGTLSFTVSSPLTAPHAAPVATPAATASIQLTSCSSRIPTIMLAST